MTVKEAWRGFIMKHRKELIESQYSVESEEDQSLLLMQGKRFKHIQRQGMAEETEAHINFSDVTEYSYYPAQPPDVSEITKEHQLLIVGGKTRIQITVSPYDKSKMDQRWTPDSNIDESVSESTEEEA